MVIAGAEPRSAGDLLCSLLSQGSISSVWVTRGSLNWLALSFSLLLIFVYLFWFCLFIYECGHALLEVLGTSCRTPVLLPCDSQGLSSVYVYVGLRGNHFYSQGISLTLLPLLKQGFHLAQASSE